MIHIKISSFDLVILKHDRVFDCRSSHPGSSSTLGSWDFLHPVIYLGGSVRVHTGKFV